MTPKFAWVALVIEDDESPHPVDVGLLSADTVSGGLVCPPKPIPCEIGNALSAMVKRRQIRPEDVIPVFEVTQQVPVNLTRVDIKRSLEIAVEHHIYAYDAYFLQCAQALSCPLVTLDLSLAKTAGEMRIKTLRLS